MNKKCIYDGIEYSIGDIVLMKDAAVTFFELERNIFKIENIVKSDAIGGFSIVLDNEGWRACRRWNRPPWVGFNLLRKCSMSWIKGKATSLDSKAYDVLFGGKSE